MQIYTKIFIGMALGVVLGVVLGPQSPWLEHDQIVLSDPGRLHLLMAPGASKPWMKLPTITGASYRLPLRLLGTRELGHERYYELSFEVDDRLALKDLTGKLKAKAVIRGWAAARSLPLPGSALGHTIIGLVAPLGTLFLRLIRMIVVPLVFASLLVGVASIGDPRQLGRLGGKTLGYFLLTTAVAISIGLLVVNLIEPGRRLSAKDKRRLVTDYGVAAQRKAVKASEHSPGMDRLLQMVPTNPVKAMARGAMLQIIFFAAVFGFALTLLRREVAAPVVAFFSAVNDAMIKIVDAVMKLAPYGVFALMAQVVGSSGVGVLMALLVYALCVGLGLSLHAMFVYTGVAYVIGRISPFAFWRAARPAQLIAFSTSSSSATLPVTMECAERGLGISNRVASFVLPLGSTVNMDGTALYQGVAAVFIAQVFDIHLTLPDQLSIVLTATLASVGAAGVPGVGMVTLALVLMAIQVPTAGVALILGVDRILDMFRTAVNVTGDLSAAVLVASTEGEELIVGPRAGEGGVRDRDAGDLGSTDHASDELGLADDTVRQPEAENADRLDP